MDFEEKNRSNNIFFIAHAIMFAEGVPCCALRLAHLLSLSPCFQNSLLLSNPGHEPCPDDAAWLVGCVGVVCRCVLHSLALLSVHGARTVLLNVV